MTTPPTMEDLLEGGRVVGRANRPDLAAALDAVRDRATKRALRVRRRVRAAAGVVLSCGLLLAGVALWPQAGEPRGRLAATESHQAVEPATSAVQPSILLSRARIAPADTAEKNLDGAASAGAVPRCSAGGLSLEMALGQDAFEPAQPVVVTLVLRNRTAAACSAPLDACHSGITVSGLDGSTAYASGADTTWLCASSPSTLTLAPGGIARLGYTWPAHACAPPGADCRAPGLYRLDATWAGLAGPDLVTLPRHVVIRAGQFS